MNNSLKKILFLLICLMSGVQINAANQAENKKLEEKAIKDDAQLIKGVMAKFFEQQINECGYLDRHIMSRVMDHICYQFAVYYNQLANYKDDPERAIKIVTEFMQNSEAYIEAAVIYLQQMDKDMTRQYNLIKNKYQKGFWERLIDDEIWKKKLNTNELAQINELEINMFQVKSIISLTTRTRTLFKVIDWATHSSSPFAWLVRKYIGI